MTNFWTKFSLLFFISEKLHIAKMTVRAEIPSLLKRESFIYTITARTHKLSMLPLLHHIHRIKVARNITTSLWSNWSHLLDLMNMLDQHASQLDQRHGQKLLLSVLAKPNTVSIEVRGWIEGRGYDFITSKVYFIDFYPKAKRYRGIKSSPQHHLLWLIPSIANL